MRFSIMQGRLVPPSDGLFQCFPRERWRDEFALAGAAGLVGIEWIYDLHGADVNPIATDEGLKLIDALCAETGVVVRSLCADYFMDRPLLRARDTEVEERLDTLTWLLRRCERLGIQRVVLPFVDASRIESDADRDDVVALMGRITPILEETGIEVHLETSLPPTAFAAMLARLPQSVFKVNYDSGNSASLGYDPADEFAAYGERIGSVHIKDRVNGGGTVALGAGDANFAALFEGLAEIGYAGDFVLQVARGTAGDEVSWARQNCDFVLGYQKDVA
jgi:hexulose-6-phosphate isomerase